jgi:hypothetical protein
MRTNEDRELDIRLAELQIRHQHIASIYTVLLSLTASLSAAFFIGYLTIGFTLKNSTWIVDGIVVLVAGGLLAYIIYGYYLKRIRRLESEVQKLKEEYLW